MFFMGTFLSMFCNWDCANLPWEKKKTKNFYWKVLCHKETGFSKDFCFYRTSLIYSKVYGGKYILFFFFFNIIWTCVSLMLKKWPCALVLNWISETVLGEVWKNNFTALPGKGGHSRRMPSKTMSQTGRGC